MIRAQKQLRGSVPASSHVLSEDIGLEVMEEGSSQAEVTNLEVAVGVDQQISRLLRSERKYEVAMDYLGRVDVFEASEELVEEKFVVFLCQRLVTLDNLSEVSVHHFRNDIAA